MIPLGQVKLSKKIHNIAKDIQRDPRYPFENDSLFYSYATNKISELWSDLISQKADDRFVKYYDDVISIVNRMKKQEMVDVNARGIRSLEEIKNAS